MPEYVTIVEVKVRVAAEDRGAGQRVLEGMGCSFAAGAAVAELGSIVSAEVIGNGELVAVPPQR